MTSQTTPCGSEDSLSTFHKLLASSFDEAKATKVRKGELLAILKYVTDIPGVLDLVPGPPIEKQTEDSQSTTASQATPTPANQNKQETERVCRDAWKGMPCSSPSSCPRIHPTLCDDGGCTGRDSCGLFHGRKRSSNSRPNTNKKKPTKPRAPASRSLGNGQLGSRHPNKKTVLPHFASAREEEYYLRYRLAAMERPMSYRDAVVAPSPPLPQPQLIMQTQAPLPPVDTPPPTPGMPTAPPRALALPALAEAIQKAVLAALSASNLSGLSC